MSVVLGHQCRQYIARYGKAERYNGAYYYTEELERNIIPHIVTDRTWVLFPLIDQVFSHAIFIVHNNLGAMQYQYLYKCKDLILVCGIPETCETMKIYGETLYLPLSIDVEEVKQYRRPKTKGRCYAGRSAKKAHSEVDLSDVDILANLPRHEFLARLAEYEEVYAVGRVALEAQVLGCKVLPYDKRFPDPDRWVVYDNKDVIPILQAGLDEIEARKK